MAYSPRWTGSRRGIDCAAVSLLAIGIAIAMPTIASAQAPAADAAAAATPTAAPVTMPADVAPETSSAAGADAAGEIIVTGSRIARTGFSAPTPTTVLSSENLQQQGLTNVATLLSQIPAVRGATSSSTATTARSDTAGAYLVNLRGLGAVRTLVLIDGQRVVPTSVTGTVDLNTVPAIMLDRTEVVTGGASAAYGSDAVSGVVNLILKRKFNGFNAEVQAGVSQYGDNADKRAAAVWGHSFAEGRGHVLIGGEYDIYGGIGNLLQRDWARRAVGVTVGAGGVRYVVDDFQVSNQTYGGIINSGPLRGTAFGPGGTPFAFQYGNLYGAPNSTTMSGGGNPASFNYDQAPIAVPFERYSTMGRFDFAASEALNLNATLAYSHAGGSRLTVEPRDASLVVRLDNAYLPAPVRQQMVTAGVSTITVGRNSRDLGAYIFDGRTNVYRGGLGADGKLGGSWKWDAHASYGETRLAYNLPNMRIDGAAPGDAAGTQRWLNAIDAVVSPTTGQIVCRSSLTNPTNGCVPFNIFGEQSVTAAQRAWLTGNEALRQKTSQYAAAANLQGEPFSTWAGPVSVAVGGEWRRDAVRTTTDATSQVRAFNIGNPQPISGHIEVYEGYGEVLVPLLRDVTLFKSLDFNGAVRRTHYSTAGSVTTWKLGGTWQVNDDLRFRATRSRDIRAPNLNDVFAPLATGNAQVVSNGISVLSFTQTAGNPNLKAEIAKTFSGGVGLSPHWVPRLRLNVDYFNITIDGAIATIPAQAILTGCQQGGVAAYCALIGTLNGSPLINLSQQNVNTLKTSGVDIELTYNFPLGPGRMDLGAYATYVAHLITKDTSGTYDRAGQNSSGGIFVTGADTPHWTGDANVHYSIGQLGLNAHVRYVQGAALDKYAPAGLLSLNHISSRTYLNLAADYTIPLSGGRSFQIFGAINNVLNLDPPRNLPYQYFNSGTASTYYDAAGRAFTIGARVKL